MGLRPKPIGVWVFEVEDQPQVKREFDLWYDSRSDYDFSHYWNRTIRYPRCRFYHDTLRGRFHDWRPSGWRFYFDTQADLTAWLLGADLHTE